jgi:hypothetical protein
MITLSPSTLLKVKRGLMVMCDCGNAHIGRHDKCSKCLTKPCERCKTSFIKGSQRICQACLRKRSLRST